MKRSIQLSPDDTVVTVLSPAKAGDTYSIVDVTGKECGQITLAEDIPFAHKAAVKEMRAGDKVIKMNVVIGEASKNISIGNYVHVHNVLSIEGRRGIK